jgi:crossover junction endodeoxyribonuclease RuvC
MQTGVRAVVRLVTGGGVRVVGVDPGLSRCGIGIVEGPAHRPHALRAGVIRTPPGDATSKRLAALHAELTTVLLAAGADAVAVERVFFSGNARTAMGVGQAAGIVLLCAEQAGLSVVEYTPTQVKAAVAGSGTAGKEQVGYMVAALLRLDAVPQPPDATDALALALCHLQLGDGRRQAPPADAPSGRVPA